MRKSALDEPHADPTTAAVAAVGVAPHAPQADATHAQDASTSAATFGEVIAVEIGAEAASHDVMKDGQLAHFASGAAVVSTVVIASPSLHQLAQREERVKKSVAYRHTSFHRLVLDSVGKEYEKRMCNYCNAAFSFKGGTTSAALRHLKTSHAERILYTGDVNMSTPHPRLQQQLHQELQQQGEQLQQLVQQAEQQVYGESEVTDTTNEGVQQATAMTDDQQASVAVQVVGSAPVPSSSPDPEHAFDGSHQPSGNSAAQYADHSPVALHETIMDNTVVAEENDGHVDEDESEVLSEEKHLRQQKARQPGVKRKRQRDDTDSGINGDNGPAPIAASATNPLPLTASQQAITHFLQHYKEMLALPNRLRFVKHLTHHPSEAEMYNVLDAATQMEYVREFSDHGTTI